MKKILSFVAVLCMVGCLATENRKVEITHKRADGTVAPVDTEACWWRIPYTADRKNHPMDRFIPLEDMPGEHLDEVDRDLRFFSENALRWPEKMRKPYRPRPIWVTPAPRLEQDSSLKRRLEQPLKPRGEVY